MSVSVSVFMSAPLVSSRCAQLTPNWQLLAHTHLNKRKIVKFNEERTQLISETWRVSGPNRKQGSRLCLSVSLSLFPSSLFETPTLALLPPNWVEVRLKCAHSRRMGSESPGIASKGWIVRFVGGADHCPHYGVTLSWCNTCARS